MRVRIQLSNRSRKALAATVGSVILILVIGSAFVLAGHPSGQPFHVVVPRGTSLAAITDSLASRDVVRWPRGFRWYARLLGAADQIKAGTYEVRRSEGWARMLRRLVEGDVVTVPITIPEGATARQIAARLATVTEASPDSIEKVLYDTASAARFGVPGPNLEGYLYPETYRFALGLPLDEVIEELVRAYRYVWTFGREARARALDLSEREVVTLASIIEAEALRSEEMPLIAAVYHNRLRRGMRLQADPTVQYALEQHKSRLLYKHIEQTRDHPYNTYEIRGLPPGPIGSPSEAAIDAALNPADVPYLYFVARRDGTHVFTSTHRDHINAKNRIVRERRRARLQARESS